MFLVRWTVRRYRGHRQWEDLLTAAYARAWVTARTASSAGHGAGEVAKRLTKAAVWAACDWCRSAENEGRTHGRSNSRYVLLPEVVHLTGGEWERYAREGGEEWLEHLVEEIDHERGASGGGADTR